MKKLIFTLTTAMLLVLTSCKNIEKMVDKGQYDKAISYAVSKLEGKKNKKTKYVKALERAYTKVNKQDAKQIDALLGSTNVSRYDKIYDIYHRLDRRQNTVMRLDPLISQDGYVAEFVSVDYNHKINKVSELASEAHYLEAKRLISIARITDKYAARRAYYELCYIEQYNSNYKNTEELYRHAYELGVDHISVVIRINDLNPNARLMTDEVYNMNVNDLNDFWTQFHLGDSKNIPYDYTASIEINNIDPGYEREIYNTYQESKDIEDGEIPIKDINGNTVVDTAGNIIYTKKYRTVVANITELRREKYARLTGKTVIRNNNNNSLVRSIPLDITHHFEDYSTVYRGDDRALSSTTKDKLKAVCSFFPSDYDMIIAMTEDFRETAYHILDRDIR